MPYFDGPQPRKAPMTTQKNPQSPSRTRFAVFSWTAVALMAALIFWMSANSGESVNHGLGVISAIKGALASGAFALFGREIDVSPVGHFAEYLVFGALLLNALRLHLGTKQALTLAVAVALASAYGVSDEWHQSFVPDRSCDAADWAVDTVAALCGASLARLFLLRRS